jgi:hypothetical protein
MKLTKAQKQTLKNHDWDIVSNEHGNCSWISVNPQDGKIFAELVEHFDLTGDGEDIKLLVVATSEEESNI